MKRGLSAPQRGRSYGSQPNSTEVPLSSSQEMGVVGSCQTWLLSEPFSASSTLAWCPSQAWGRPKESSIMALNGGPDGKKATAALYLGQGCQEESSGATISQCSSRHSSTWHRGGSPLPWWEWPRCWQCSGLKLQAPWSARGSIILQPPKL